MIRKMDLRNGIFENGQLKTIRNYKKGFLEGPYEQYFENGELKMKRTYKNDKKDGPEEWYFENGELEMKCTNKNDMQDGPVGMVLREWTVKIKSDL